LEVQQGEDHHPLLAPSRTALTRLLAEKRAEHGALSARAETSSVLRQPSWRPRGQLVAHLAEHRGPVARLAAVPDTTLFTSAGADGSLRVWDCAKMEGRALANKNRLVHQRGTPLDSLAASGQPQVVATGGRDGTLALFHLEKQGTVASRQVALEEEGAPVDLAFSQLSASPLLLYATSFGALVGWDLRKPGDALRFEGDLRQGLTTAMCLGADETWAAAATSAGVVSVWDLRFRLRVSGLAHPGKARVRRLVAGPGPGQLLAAVQGNNEVGLWSLESGFRHTAVWASPSTPLSPASSSQHSVCCAAICGAGLLTGGTDCKIRYWHLPQPQDSFVVGAEAAHQPQVKSRLVEGTEVLVETSRQGARQGKEEGVRLAAEVQHTDWVTDLALCETTQPLLVTASNDGCIKVWK